MMQDDQTLRTSKKRQVSACLAAAVTRRDLSHSLCHNAVHGRALEAVTIDECVLRTRGEKKGQKVRT